MRPHHSCPASAVSSQLTGMAAVAGVGMMHLVDSMREAGAEAREASVYQTYANALMQAQTYAYEVAHFAESAVKRVRELEAEVDRLTNACRQRQAVIDSFRGAA